jgi:predicted kinase
MLMNLTVLCGISAAGKSTWARQMVASQPYTVVVSKDDLRQSLFGYTHQSKGEYYTHPSIAEREQVVTAALMASVKACLDSRYNVILDDTNIDISNIDLVRRTFKEHVKYKLLDIDIQTAIDRDQKRSYSVGSDLIRQQYKRLQVLKSQFDFHV